MGGYINLERRGDIRIVYDRFTEREEVRLGYHMIDLLGEREREVRGQQEY